MRCFSIAALEFWDDTVRQIVDFEILPVSEDLTAAQIGMNLVLKKDSIVINVCVIFANGIRSHQEYNEEGKTVTRK